MSGPGRRLSDHEEARGAGLFAAGKSEREVADVLGCSPSSAHRLRLRLDAAGSEPEETTVTEHNEDQDEAELTELAKQHDAQARTVQGLEEREAVSRSAAASLEAEHLAGLAEGRSDPELRQRHENAAKDAGDWAKGAELARGKLAAIDQQITAVLARRADRQLRADLAEAVAERDVVLAAVGARQRAAVTAVRTAAEDFTAAFADELAALARVDELAALIALGGPVPDVPPPESTGLWVSADYVAGQPVALMRAISEARAGNAATVARQLGEAFGWLPPDPAELAAERARVLALRAGQLQPGPPPSVDLDPRFGASYSVSRDGTPLRAPDPERPRPQQVVRPGSLGFQPWPG
jgi:transposase